MPSIMKRFLEGGEAIDDILASLSEEEIEREIRKSNFQLFIIAMKSGNEELILPIFQAIEHKPELQEEMVSKVFCYGAETGDMQILENLSEMFREDELMQEVMLTYEGYKAFCLANQKGHEEAVQHIRSMTSSPNMEDLMAPMLAAYDSKRLCAAIAEGNVVMVGVILDEIAIAEQKKEAIFCGNFEVARKAVTQGNIAIVVAIFSVLTPQQQQEMMMFADDSGKSALMRAALRNGNPQLVRFILDVIQDPAQKQAMAADHVMLQRALEYQKLEAIKVLLDVVVDPAQKQAIATNPAVLQLAVTKADFGFITEIFNLVSNPEQKRAIAAAPGVLKLAVANDNFAFINKIFRVVNPAQKQEMIAALNAENVVLNPSVSAIINLENLLAIAENPDFKASQNSIILEMMRRAFCSTCNSLNSDKTIPVTAENLRERLTPEQIEIAEKTTRGVAAYILENTGGFRNMVNHSTSLRRRSPDDVSPISTLPTEMDLVIAQNTIPHFAIEIRELSQPLSKQGVKDLTTVYDKVVQKVLDSAQLTPKTIFAAQDLDVVRLAIDKLEGRQ